MLCNLCGKYLLKITLFQAVWRIPGQYLVFLHPDVSQSQVQESKERLRAICAGGGHPLEVLQMYTGALRGFLVKMRSDTLPLVTSLELSALSLLALGMCVCTNFFPQVERLPHVIYIEEDSSIFAQGTLRNLQRLTQPHATASGNGTHGPPGESTFARSRHARFRSARAVLRRWEGGGGVPDGWRNPEVAPRARRKSAPRRLPQDPRGGGWRSWRGQVEIEYVLISVATLFLKRCRCHERLSLVCRPASVKGMAHMWRE